MNTTTKKYTINDVGCYIDGHVGIYQGQHVQELASSHGMQIEPIGPWHCETEEQIADCIEKFWVEGDNDCPVQNKHTEEYNWRTDEALEWLNANMVEDDVLFEFIDGEFFLSSIAQHMEEWYNETRK